MTKHEGPVIRRGFPTGHVPAGALALGSLFQANSLWHPSIFGERFRIFGTTTTILPLANGYSGAPSATTFTTRYDTASGMNATFTWSEAPNAFDTALRLTDRAAWQGVVPFLDLNGTDEEADSPDAAGWSRNDAAGEAFTWVFWANVTNSAAIRTLVAKYDTAVAIQEYWLVVNASDFLEFRARDDSVPIEVTRISDAAITMGSISQFAMTYDGSGGATAMNGATLYQDGAAIASTAANDATYVAMENGTSTLSLFHSKGAAGAVTNPFLGRVGIGGLGPLTCNVAATAAQIKADYELGRMMLAL